MQFVCMYLGKDGSAVHFIEDHNSKMCFKHID